MTALLTLLHRRSGQRVSSRKSAAVTGSALLLAALLALPGAPVWPTLRAQDKSPTRPPAPQSFIIRGARIFDGQRMLPPADVLVADGRIQAIGAKLRVPDATKEIDASGDTLLPGLIDAHTHAFGGALQQALVFGVTTEFCMFCDFNQDAQVRLREAQGKNLDAADLRSSGTCVTAPRGHGTEYGINIPTLSSATEAQAFVDARLAEGSDYIKIIYDDGSAYGRKIPTLSKEELAAVIAAAHQRHKLAVVHIGSQAGARDAIASGADGLAHIFEDESPAADFPVFAKQHHAFVIATLSVNESAAGIATGASLVRDARFAPFLYPQDVSQLQKYFPHGPASKENFANALAAIRALHAADVPVLAGTDAPNPGTLHGASMHRELQLLVQAGLAPSEALAAATSLPARLFGLTDRGRIASGLRADLLLVQGDPSRDITATRNIVAVWKTGAEADRLAFRAKAEAERGAAEEAAKADPPPGSQSGLISDFEEDTSAKFGAGWSVSTDSVAGGKSSAEIKRVPEGAHNSRGALEVSGNISSELGYAWAGAMFSPGKRAFYPAKLSAKKTIHFWARGDGRKCRLMVYTQTGGYQPAQKEFVPQAEWQEFTFPFSAFATDGRDITAIIFATGPDPGPFRFLIDDVRLD